VIRFRASSLWEIMGDPKTGTGLSVTAQTALDCMAKEMVYGFNEVVDSKEMRKGIECEQASIDLLNRVLFERYVKNTERRTNDSITGEPDIVAPSLIRDIKSAWSLKTFPATKERVLEIAKKSGYDWQGRAYMALWDLPEFSLDYCLTSTPEDLRRYEQVELHQVDHIAPHLRVTSATIKRDMGLERKIWDKVGLAREYLTRAVEQIKQDHDL
jgi:hypothetical protein